MEALHADSAPKKDENPTKTALARRNEERNIIEIGVNEAEKKLMLPYSSMFIFSPTNP